MNKFKKLATESVGDLVGHAIQIVCASQMHHNSKLELVDILIELGLRLRQVDRLGPRQEAP
jgi:hypothetical protein